MEGRRLSRRVLVERGVPRPTSVWYDVRRDERPRVSNAGILLWNHRLSMPTHVALLPGQS